MTKIIKMSKGLIHRGAVIDSLTHQFKILLEEWGMMSWESKVIKTYSSDKESHFKFLVEGWEMSVKIIQKKISVVIAVAQIGFFGFCLNSDKTLIWKDFQYVAAMTSDLMSYLIDYKFNHCSRSIKPLKRV